MMFAFFGYLYKNQILYQVNIQLLISTYVIVTTATVILVNIPALVRTSEANIYFDFLLSLP